MVTFTEGRHGGEFIIDEMELNGSRDVITVGGGNLSAGSVVGKLTKGAATKAAVSGGNTGNGTFTLDVTAPVLAGAKRGIYTARVVGGTAGVSTANHAGKVGNGTCGTLTVDAGADAGVWVVKCTDVDAVNTGTFSVTRPDGTADGIATVGVAYNSPRGINFTLTDGSTDYAEGDQYDVTVTQAVPVGFGYIVVKDPDGTDVGAVINLSASGAFVNQIKFVAAPGLADFIVGDGFDVTVTAVPGEYVLSPTSGSNGAQTGAAILIYNVDATTDAVQTTALVRKAIVNKNRLVLDVSINDAPKTLTKLGELSALKIVAR